MTKKEKCIVELFEVEFNTRISELVKRGFEYKAFSTDDIMRVYMNRYSPEIIEKILVAMLEGVKLEYMLDNVHYLENFSADQVRAIAIAYGADLPMESIEIVVDTRLSSDQIKIICNNLINGCSLDEAKDTKQDFINRNECLEALKIMNIISNDVHVKLTDSGIAKIPQYIFTEEDGKDIVSGSVFDKSIVNSKLVDFIDEYVDTARFAKSVSGDKVSVGNKILYVYVDKSENPALLALLIWKCTERGIDVRLMHYTGQDPYDISSYTEQILM